MKSFQPNFAGGIMSDGMLARNDLVKYQVGVSDAVNLFVRQQGGLANRSGTRLAAGVDVTGGGAPPVLVPFQFSADEAYVLEFHDGVFRVLLDGAYALDNIVKDRAVTSISIANDPIWAVNAAGMAAGDVVYVTAPAANWLNGQVARVTGTPTGGVRLRMADGNPISTADGAPDVAGVKITKVYSGTHPYSAADMRDVRYAQDADYLYMAHRDYPPYRLRRMGHAQWLGENVTFAPGIIAPFSVRYDRSITAADKGENPIWTVPGHGFQQGDVVSVRGSVNWFPNRALRVSDVLDANRVRLRPFEGGVLNTTGLPTIHADAVLVTNASSTVLADDPKVNDNAIIETYRVSAMTAQGEEGPASPNVDVYIDLTFRGNRAVISWRPLPGAKRYIVYRDSGGAFGYIGATENTFFVDDNIAPDTSQGPQEPRNPFVGPGNYPGVVAFHEQRLFLGGTRNDPQLVEASQTANPLNFGTSYPPRDSDALTFRPKHKQINAIRSLVSGVALMVMTSGGEWALSGGGEEGRPLTPNNLFLRPVSYWGSADIEPALIGDVLVMLQRGSKIARDYRLGGDRPSDLTIMAADLLRNATITGWAFCQTPYSVLWVTLSDGTLLSMTYNAEHDIWGWTRHKLGGTAKVLQVVSVLEGAEDALYLVVERTREGGVRHVTTERMSARWDNDEVRGVYLDASRSVTYDNPTGTAEGLVHLAGEVVTALVDGNVYHDLTVDLVGRVSIGGRTGKHWVVGYAYTSRMETLPLETEVQGYGSTLGAKRRAPEASVLVERTRGLWVGDSADRMEQVKEWTETDAQRIPLRTVVHTVTFLGDWETRPTICVEQRDPLPMTILGVAPNWEIGG